MIIKTEKYTLFFPAHKPSSEDIKKNHNSRISLHYSMNLQANTLQKSILSQEFYKPNTLDIAKQLLGTLLCHYYKGELLGGQIVETEAYTTPFDEACHAYRKKTRRNAPMFEKPGTLYVYFTYGNHHMLNIATEPEGQAAAVLIRAIVPMLGIDTMLERRRMNSTKNLTNGPGKLTQAMAISTRHSGLAQSNKGIFIARPAKIEPFEMGVSTRIGITRSRELPWRFFVKGNRHVSKGKPS